MIRRDAQIVAVMVVIFDVITILRQYKLNPLITTVALLNYFFDICESRLMDSLRQMFKRKSRTWNRQLLEVPHLAKRQKAA